MAIEVRDLAGFDQWWSASALYRAVFGYAQPEFGVSPRLLAALRDNSGSVIGAFDGEALVGFCYGFTAVDGGEIYHYSQAAVVAPRAQGSGIGRRLKYAQAEAARGTGARTMRWTFDPYALRNAHFNLAVLGATGVQFLPDYYDDGSSDRLLVSWNLDGPHVSAGPRRDPDSAADSPDGAADLPIPDIVRAMSDGFVAAREPAERARLRDALMARFEAGAVLVDVQRRGDQAAYVFAGAAE